MIAVDFHILDVGQGSANFVVIRDAANAADQTGTVKSTLLIDIGSQSENSAEAKESVGVVARTLADMSDANRHIAVLALSHSDKDHTSLLANVLLKFRPPHIGGDKPPLTIDNIFYSGSEEEYVGTLPDDADLDFIEACGVPFEPGTYDVVNLLALARAYSGRDACGFPLSQCDFHAAGWRPFWPTPERPLPSAISGLNVDLSLLIGNADEHPNGDYPQWKGKKPSAAVINRRSLVTVFRYAPPAAAAVQFVATGDATGATMALAVHAVPLASRDTAFPNVVHVTAPHHGSKTSGYNITGASRTQQAAGFPLADQAIQNFVALLRAQTLSASAGFGYDHPSMSILMEFAGALIPAGYGEDSRIAPFHLVTATIAPSFFVEEEGGDAMANVAHMGGIKKAKNKLFPPKPKGLQKVKATVKALVKKSKDPFYTIRTPLNIYTTQYATGREHQKYLLRTAERIVRKEPLDTILANPFGVLWTLRYLQNGSASVGFSTAVELQQALRLGLPLPMRHTVSEFTPQPIEPLPHPPAIASRTREKAAASFRRARTIG